MPRQALWRVGWRLFFMSGTVTYFPVVAPMATFLRVERTAG